MKRGFLNRKTGATKPSEPVPVTVSNHSNHFTPKVDSVEPIYGPNPPTQKFSNLLATSASSDSESTTSEIKPSTYVLVNFDLCDGSDAIPMIVTPETLDVLRKTDFPLAPNLGGELWDGNGVNWEIKERADGQNGLFALKNFEVGDLIVAERPLQIAPIELIPKSDSSKPAEAFDISEVLHKRQNEAQQDLYLQLRGLRKSKENLDELQSIMASCQGHVKFGDEGATYKGVFFVNQHINHSCGPSAKFTPLGAEMIAHVRAVRPIVAGEEITVMWMRELAESREKRKEILQERFGFDCQCPICSLLGNEQDLSDSRHAQIKDLLGVSLRDLQNDDVSEDSVYCKYQELLKLCEEESLQVVIGGVWEKMVITRHAMGDEEGCKEWATESLPNIRAHGGERTVTYKQMFRYAMDPRSIPGFAYVKHIRSLGSPGPAPPGVDQKLWKARFQRDNLKLEHMIDFLPQEMVQAMWTRPSEFKAATLYKYLEKEPNGKARLAKMKDQVDEETAKMMELDMMLKNL